ncbi:hypothetical protein KC358_g71 [Hortaea werneckii]|nr:hypothetical protein KC358_g71 [Hortaea werneckii]
MPEVSLIRSYKQRFCKPRFRQPCEYRHTRAPWSITLLFCNAPSACLAVEAPGHLPLMVQALLAPLQRQQV